MKFLCLAGLLALTSCANLRQVSSVDGLHVAYDTSAGGKVKAQATKKIEHQDVCFDISIVLRGASAADASPGNWSLAWVDQKNQYHLLRLNQRDPASVPQKEDSALFPLGESHEWSNTFRTCAAKAELHDVKSIVLTPKDLPYQDKRGLRLGW